MKTITIELTQEEANLLLRALEEILEKKGLKESTHVLWDKIFTTGLDAGFGEQNEQPTKCSSLSK